MKHIVNTSTGSIKDTKDCTVRALSNAFKIPYEEAHKLATEAGRKKHRGFSVDKIMAHLLATKGWKAKKVVLPVPVTLGRFTQVGSKRTLQVVLRKHTLVTKNRVIHDHMHNKPSCLVQEYWVIGLDAKAKFDCPIMAAFPKPTRNLRTQDEIVVHLGKNGWDQKRIAEETGIQITNVVHFYSKFKSLITGILKIKK